MPKYGKIRGAIRWYSRLPKLRKPIFASMYSRYFAGCFALRRCRNSIRRYSAAPKCEFRSQFPLLPLYSTNGLRRQVVADAADAGNFGGNACSDALQQRPVKLGNFSGHNVSGVDAANDAGRLLGYIQSSFEFGWNASLLARCISHICYLYPVGNIFPDWVMHLL